MIESKRCKDYKHNEQISSAGFAGLPIAEANRRKTVLRKSGMMATLENYY